MITISIPVFNPNIDDFRKTINSALKTKTNEIIIVDDCSNKENEEYFNYLIEIKNSDNRVKIIYNNENKGRFLNSYYAVCMSTNKYVKKLDADDELIPEEFNKLLEEKHEEDIIFTRYSFKNKKKNKGKKSKWNLFNGSAIYKTESLKDLDINNAPKNFFGDIIFISHIISKSNSTVGYSEFNCYRYMIVGSTTPSKLLDKYDDWLKGYNWLKNNSIDNEIIKFTIEKQDIFYEIMMIKLKKEYTKTKFKYFKSWNFTPKFIKKIVAHFTFKV